MMSSISPVESISSLTAFVITVEAGGFAAAARRLGLSPSAVGKAVSRMELRLNVRLLTRTTRQVMMTYEGEQLYQRARNLLDDLRDIENLLATQRSAPIGRVRVSLPATLGRMVVVPRLEEFILDHPGIDLEIGLDDRKVDLVEGGYDLAIRTGVLEDSALVARKLAPHRFYLCASPQYLAQYGTPESLDALWHHKIIRFRYPTSQMLEKWSFDGREYDRELPQGLVFNDGEAVARAAMAGLGIAQLPDYACAQAIGEGQLVQLLTDLACIRGDLWLVRPSQRAEVPRIRAFATFLDAILGGS